MAAPFVAPGLLEMAIAQSFNAVVITDANFLDGGPHIVFCNPAFCTLTGYPQEELLGQSPRILQGPATDAAVIDRLRTSLLEGRHFHGQTINYRKDGQPYDLEWNISPVRDASGEITHFVSVQQDISSRVRAERQRDMLAQAINATPDPVFIMDRDLHVRFVNQAFEQATGYALEDVLGQTPAFWQSGEQDHLRYDSLAQRLSGAQRVRDTFLNRRKNGELYFSDQSIAALRDQRGEVQYYVSIGKDISQHVRKQQALKDLANRDQLTGLFNRRYGDAVLSHCQSRAEAGARIGCVVVCDIDHFKRINDTLGHAEGDAVLIQVANLLTEGLRSADVVVRWGGDEFLLYLPGTEEADAVTLLARLCRQMARLAPSEAGGATLSVGVAEWQPGESRADVLTRADMALYRAKERGRNQVAVAQPLLDA